MKKNLLKVVVITAALGLLGYLFVRSVQETRAEPYQVARAHLQGWTLATEPGGSPGAPRLSLRLPREMGSSLFRQLFARAAESMSGPSVPSVPLLLQEEYSRALDGRVPLDEILAMAQEAGLTTAAFAPRCVAYRRESAPGVTRQLYFVYFDAPAFGQFRHALAARAGDGFDAGALSPVMFVAASDADFNRWLPLRVNPDAECVAGVTVE